MGTWVGGLGTVVAVLVAARTFQHQQNLSERESLLQSAETTQALRELESDAARVGVEVRELASAAGILDSVVLTVRNGTHGRTIYDVTVHADGLARPWEVAMIEAKDTREQTVVVEDKRIARESVDAFIREMRDGASVSFVMDAATWKRTGESSLIRVS